RADYIANAIEVGGPETDRLCAAASSAGIDVAIGITELDPNTHGSVYCTLLFIGREGRNIGLDIDFDAAFGRDRLHFWKEGIAYIRAQLRQDFARVLMG
ncbi:MAG: hypothetical protein IIC52_12480, partial [Proteobacteria bacterium]|nr:hypothetical protein [Pseudomonadota bacterium]